MFVTIAPESAGRDTARVLFRLGRRARVRLDAVRTGIGTSSVRWTTEATLGPGSHAMAWTPADDVPVGSYVMRLTVEGKGGRRVYGGRRPASPERASAPVVHVLGIEAAFTRRSYLPTERMAMQVLADVPSFTLTFLRVGYGPDPSLRNDEMVGLEMGEPGADRLDREALDAADDHRPVGRLAERALRGAARGGRRSCRLRAVHPSRRDAERAARRRRASDQHLAGLQPVRRRRRRLGRHVVRGRQAAGRAHPRVSGPRGAAAIPALRLPLSPLPREDPA